VTLLRKKLLLVLRALFSCLSLLENRLTSSKVVILLVCLLALVTLFVPSYFEMPLRWKSAGTLSLGRTSYAGPAKPTGVFGLPNQRLRNLELEFSFLAKKPGPATLLKTDVEGKGLILELTKDERLLIKNEAPPPFAIEVEAFPQIKIGETYSAKLSISEGSKIAFTLRWSGDKKSDFKYENHSLDFRLSELLLGGDASGKNSFVGNVLLNSAKATFVEPIELQVWRRIIQPVRFISVFVFFLMGVLACRNSWLNERFSARQDKLTLSSTILLTTFIGAVFYHFIMGVYLGWPHPYNSFLFFPWAKFSDYTGARALHKALNPYSLESVYPPLMFLLSYPLTQIGDDEYSYLEPAIMIVFFIAILFWTVFKLLKTKDSIEDFKLSVIFCLLNYPVLFLIDRGNLDLIMFPFLFLGLVHLYKRNSGAAAFFLGFATALKITPAIFFLFLIKEKKYKEVIFAGIGIIAVNVAAAAFFKSGVAGTFQLMLRNMGRNYLGWALTDFSVYYTHTLKGMIRMLSYNFSSPTFQDGIQKWHSTYKVVTGLILISTMGLVYLRKGIEYWKGLTLVSITTLLLPLFSPDYKLVILIIPMILFLTSERKDRNALLYTVLFSLIFVPKSFFWIKFVPWEAAAIRESSPGPIITPIILFILWLFIFGSELKSLSERRVETR